jgi:hypothetical protein
MSMKNSTDTIGNGTRDVPACSVVPQPTVPLHATSYVQMLPSKTSTKKSAPSFKSSKEQVTLLACSNTSGNHKTKINLIDCVSWKAPILERIKQQAIL